MKYLGKVNNIKIKAVDVFKLRALPLLLFEEIFGKDADEELYNKLLNVIKTTEDELDTIETICKAYVKGIKVEIKNSDLANYASGLVSVFVNDLDENGLLKSVKWDELGYWDFLILRTLQNEAIKEHNRRLERLKNG
jgi:hypothetical protein